MTSLSNEQINASRSVGGVTLVIAGAGTGKTKTLIRKITTIIQYGISPENILVLTFSRKAAEEIRSRVREEIGGTALGLVAGTFHSFCLRFLKEHSEIFKVRFGYPQFPAVLEEEERKSMIQDVIRKKIGDFLGIPLDVIERFVSDPLKSKGYIKTRMDQYGLSEKIREVREEFQREKVNRSVVDFQDMMNYTLDILEHDEKIRRNIMDTFRHVLVDEFQDTSPDNFRLLELITNKDSPNLFVVGDDWQSIYGFRYSNIEYIVRIKRFFPEAEIHRLTVNYRSRHEIVALSNRFIRNNRIRTCKRLRSYKGRGGIVQRYFVQDSYQENEAIASILAGLDPSAGSVAVLYRNNWQGRIIDSFLKTRISGFHNANVQLMTIHASKGLEFDTVIIAGIKDSILPDPSSDIEEERRLMYVALTRAREELHLICHSAGIKKLSLFARELNAGLFTG